MPAVSVRRRTRIVLQQHNVLVPIDMRIQWMGIVQFAERPSEIEMGRWINLGSAHKNHQVLEQYLIDRVVCLGRDRRREIEP